MSEPYITIEITNSINDLDDPPPMLAIPARGKSKPGKHHRITPVPERTGRREAERRRKQMAKKEEPHD